MSNNNEMTPQQSQPAERRQRRQPETIGELQQWYADHNLPPEEVTRFFIGRNITAPKAFGIYKDENGEFVVYKNKASGERAIRYQGPDERFAVGEILSKLKDEIAMRKGSKPRSNVSSMAASSSDTSTPSSASGLTWSFNKTAGKGCFLVGLVMAILAIFIPSSKEVPNGYYSYDDTPYYHQGSSWYRYNAADMIWALAESLDEIITKDNVDQYRLKSFSGRRFEDTEWYDKGSSYDNDDDDSNYNWDDDDSWDSDDTNWDDDW